MHTPREGLNINSRTRPPLSYFDGFMTSDDQEKGTPLESAVFVCVFF